MYERHGAAGARFKPVVNVFTLTPGATWLLTELDPD
jgi:hypothetical protein